MHKFRSALMVVVILLAGCAAGGSNPNYQGDGSLAGKIKSCRAGDTQVNSSSECMADDAACYQIADGGWCTGARGINVPVAVPNW